MTRNSYSLLGRFHAMWTLEGLGALDATLARDLLRDPNPLIRVQAIRASESLYKAGDTSFEADVRQLTKDPDTRVTIQAMLTLNLWKVPDISTVVQAAQAANKARGVQEVGRRILQPAGTAFGGGGGAGLTAEDSALAAAGRGDLRGAVRDVPRPGRERRAGRSGAGRHDEGAAACRRRRACRPIGTT